MGERRFPIGAPRTSKPGSLGGRGFEHLLKLPCSPATDPRNSWRASVRGHRTRLWIELTPRLSQILAARLPELYVRARHNAAAGMRDHGEHAAAGALSEFRPYTLDHVTGDWWP